MKNLLSENMLRFGTKNLSETSKRQLTLESIMQTIHENGLASAVKQRLSETSLLKEAFTKNYWIDSITKGGVDNASEYDIKVTGNFAAKLGFEVQRNALMGPWNQKLITVQIMPNMLVNIKTIQDLDKYLSTPNSSIQTMTLSTGKGDFQNQLKL